MIVITIAMLFTKAAIVRSGILRIAIITILGLLSKFLWIWGCSGSVGTIVALRGVT